MKRMTKNVSEIHLTGRVANPESKPDVGKEGLFSFRLAHDRWTGSESVTDWYTVNVWGEAGKQAEAILEKGTFVLVVGSPFINEYEGKDGAMRREVGISAFNVLPIGEGFFWKDGEDSAPAKKKADPDDLPF